MKYSYALLLIVAAAAMSILFSGCTVGGGHSVYSGYGYPYYGHGIGYQTVYYNNYYDDFDHRRERIDDRRQDRAERSRNMSSEQRQQAHDSLQQTRPQRVERRQVRRASRPVQNMGRPRTGGRRR